MADCQRGAKGSRRFPREKRLCCVFGRLRSCKSDTEGAETLEGLLPQAHVLWKEALLWTHMPLTPAGGSPFLRLKSPLQPQTAGCSSSRSLLSHLWPSDSAWLVFIFSFYKKQALLWTRYWWEYWHGVGLRPVLCNSKYSSRRTGTLSNTPSIFLGKKNPKTNNQTLLYTLPIVPSAGARWNFTAVHE